jgi:aminopeptidase
MYTPSKEILEKYADVLVGFAPHTGKGVQKGEVVLLQVPECAKPMLIVLRRAVLKAGGNPIIQYMPDDMEREFYEIANEEQIKFFPEKFMKGRIDQIDHRIVIIADTNKHELEGIDPKKILEKQKAFRPYQDWTNEKENAGKYTWVIALYGTQQMADEVKLSIEEYWDQIIKACYLDSKDPVKEWKRITKEIETTKEKLDALKIDFLHITAPDTDLTVGLGPNRKWLGGTGRNIPSFELFISPDWRRTEGHITFTEPLYRYGNLITEVRLEFKNGKVVKSSAAKGEKVLKEMISSENADKIGEFSLTDGRLSRITKFMGETLYDENVGGKYGNSHLALGKAYQDSYTGDPSKVTEEQWKEMGYNNSVVHTDIVATSDRTVTATLQDGRKVIIYKDGKFQV